MEEVAVQLTGEENVGLVAPTAWAQTNGARTRRALLRGSAVLVAGAGALGLAACGRAAPAADSTAPRALAGSVEFWHWGVTYVDGFDKLTAEFAEKHGGAKVNRSMPDDVDNKIKITIAAGSGAPDVYLMRGNNFQQWAHDGLAIDLGSYLRQDKTAAADAKTTLKAAHDFYVFEGKQMGLPWDLSTISVTYSLDALQRAGLKSPADMGPQWDWNAFLDYAKRLTSGTGQQYGVDASSGIETGWYNWVVANGGRFFSDDLKTCTINAPPAVEAVEQYFSVANKLQAAPPRDWLNEQTKPLPHAAYRMVNGLVAMQTAGDWFFGWYDKVANFRWDTAPVPVAPKTKKTGSVANLRGVVMAPTAQNRDLGWAWASYLITREVQDRVPTLMGEVPSRTDSIEQVYLNPAKLPSPKSRRLLKASLDATVPLAAHPLIAWNDFTKLTDLNEVYDGKRSAREALNDMQQKLAALIA